MNLLNINSRSATGNRVKSAHNQGELVAIFSICALVAMQPIAAIAASNDSATHPAPRLILQITVDALRGDLPGRFAHVLGEGGFRYLQQGVNYTNAHYQHATTETIVGHASLASLNSVPVSFQPLNVPTMVL